MHVFLPWKTRQERQESRDIGVTHVDAKGRVFYAFVFLCIIMWYIVAMKAAVDFHWIIVYSKKGGRAILNQLSLAKKPLV